MASSCVDLITKFPLLSAPETLVKVDVEDIPRHDPDEKVFECSAYGKLLFMSVRLRYSKTPIL